MLVKRIFLVVGEHPPGNEGAAAAYNIHFASFGNEDIHGTACETAVHGHEVSPVMGLLLDDFKDVFFRHIRHFAMVSDCRNRGLINGNGADHDRRMLDNGTAGGVDVVAR